MKKHLTIALAQLNFTVGAIDSNRKKINTTLQQAAHDLLADLVIFPELTLGGYPCEDLLHRQDFIDANAQALAQIIQQHPDLYSIIGYPYQQQDALYNAAAIINGQSLSAHYFKRCLPNYGVFDEKRYFKPGNTVTLFEVNQVKIGLLICEDLWFDEPLAQTVAAGAELIISLHGSPFEKNETRAASATTTATGTPSSCAYYLFKSCRRPRRISF